MKNKEKYDLRNIRYVIKLNNDEYDFVIYHNSIEIYRENFCLFSPACNAFTQWLEEEYKPNILDDVEKAYLSAVIKPFRKDVECIEKVESYYGENEFIHITMKKDEDCCELPDFENGTMYKGMETNKTYTLKELGL